MKITGDKGSMVVEHEGKKAKFYGDLCINGFAAIASTMEWLEPQGNRKATEEERLELMREVLEFTKSQKCKIYFYDDKNNKLKF